MRRAGSVHSENFRRFDDSGTGHTHEEGWEMKKGEKIRIMAQGKALYQAKLCVIMSY